MVSQEQQITSTGGLSLFGEGRYRLTRRLGRGGMAEVFAAQDARLGRTVAIKVLRPDLAEDAIARMRFTREAHAVASLNHHAVVAVYDTGEEAHGSETVPYIVMELVEGHTVRELLQSEEPPPVDQALIISAGILEALAYSHRHGIVHRDIKPANVIITTTGAVKVMDFGIARALTGATSTMTQTGMVMGTPQYLSPEQALGKPVDSRSDLYATGCMLYELLTLRPPFTGDTPLSVVYQHVQDAPVPPSQANGRVPAMLDPLVLRALAKDPDDRFQSADEMRAHVQHALRTMHQGTAMTEVLPTPASGRGPAPTVVGDPGGYRTTAMGAIGGAAATQQMGTQAASLAGGARPYDDPYDTHDGRNSRRAVFAVIAVLVAIAAITVGVALAMRHSGGGSPAPVASTSTSTTPSDSGQPSVPAPTETTPSTAPSDTYSQTVPYTPSTPATASASTTPSASGTPSSTASSTPSSTPSAPPTTAPPTQTDAPPTDPADTSTPPNQAGGGNPGPGGNNHGGGNNPTS
ncbi:serine/threonine protein kinase [Streptacidiphilus sp. PB12-B1b]|uniref:protein kinase domain-containing protein n=1 Tax=Streptacidiphilus sp. PB12-B1b TaxID=2705012 RepID=UPI0015FC73F5|nr:protein kinase [Streptacidiphilus sp. PB12-B1b]QMU79792.1 serine/threonine protein kinase [Streptacidiphilus sp. PB12-B1b]